MGKYIYINTRTASKKDIEQLFKDLVKDKNKRIFAYVTKNGNISIRTNF